jgi:hypothetical protein
MGDGYSFYSYFANLGVRIECLLLYLSAKNKACRYPQLMLVVENTRSMPGYTHSTCNCLSGSNCRNERHPDTGCHPLGVLYTNASINADAYQWEFGDGAFFVRYIAFSHF